MEGDSKVQMMEKSESVVTGAKKSKSGSTHEKSSVTRIHTKSKLVDKEHKSKSNVKLSHSERLSRKKRASMASDEQPPEDAPPAVVESSSEESSSEEEKEKKPKKGGKKKADPKKALQSEMTLKKAKGVKLKVGDDDEPTEDDLIEAFIKSKQGSYKPLPPLPDPAVLLEAAMAKVMKKAKEMKAEELEELRLKHETEINAKVDAERQRRQDEHDKMMEKEKKDQIDAQLREDQLGKSVQIIQVVIETFRQNFRAEKERLEWELYLQCKKLPNPARSDLMTKYLHIWEENMTFITIPEASEKTQEVMELMNDLEEVIALATEDDQHKIPLWNWVKQLFRDQQKACLDVATYRLMRDVVKNMERVNIPTAKYDYIDPWVTICVWLKVQNPIPLPNPRRPPRGRIEIKFKELNSLKILLPMVLDCHKKAIRVMYLKYDHLSDTCEYNSTPPLPPHYEIDLLTTCRREWRMKLKYKYVRRDKKVYQEPDPDDPDPEPWEPEPEEFDSDEEIPMVPYKNLNPTPSEYLSLLEEHKYSQARKLFQSEVPSNPHILNVRKFAILGGVFAIHYLEQPNQPQDYATMPHIRCTRLFVPKELQHVEFMIPYDPPDEYLTYDPNLPKYKQPEPEVIEEYFRQQEALDTLILITIKLPNHVIFLETPGVCIWEEEQKYWSKKYVHNTKFDPEFNKLSFRTQLFGQFGLANLRFSNLPYQNWEMKPEIDGSVTINITGAVLELEFVIKDGLISLSLLENSPNKALQKDVVGQFYKFHFLKKILKEAGVDIFPEADSYCYVEGSCEKHWPMEKHNYTNMAMMAGYFNFAWSKWNLTAGRRNIVMNMREYHPDKPKQKSHALALVTPIKVAYLQCLDESEEFSMELQEDQKYSSDLYNMMRNSVGMFLRNQIEDYDKLNIYVISEFLIATRLLSFA